MTSGNQMQVSALVALHEAEVREEFLKQRTLLLAQQLELTKHENQSLMSKINGLEADLRLARGEGDTGKGASE